MQASDSAAAASAQRPPNLASPPDASEMRLQRILKFVVVGLAIVLFAGLLAAIARVIYLASSSATQPAAPRPAIRPEQSLTLPAGAQIRSVSLSGSRLAVHYDLHGAPGIAVFDIQTGRMITNVAVEPKRPGR